MLWNNPHGELYVLSHTHTNTHTQNQNKTKLSSTIVKNKKLGLEKSRYLALI